eukprot:4430387-Pyramimonas_sp.AAC.1
MDIEGAEYELVRHLLVSGSLSKINVLIIEWHSRKMPQAQLPSSIDDAMEWMIKSEYGSNITIVHDD